MNDSKAVSAKRAMKFARTFSETIDEDDNDDFEPENIEEKEDPLSGIHLLVEIKMSPLYFPLNTR